MTSDLTPETVPGPEHWLGCVWLILVVSSGVSRIAECLYVGKCL